MSDTVRVLTPKGKASFVNILKPKLNQSGQERYTMMLLIPKTEDMTEIKNAMNAAYESEWPDPAKRPSLEILQSALKDGDTDTYVTGLKTGQLKKDTYPEMVGHWVINMMSVQPVPVVAEDGTTMVTSEEKCYSGMFCRCSIHTFAYGPDQNNPQKKFGVGLGIDGIQFLEHGDKFSGRPDPKSLFGKVAVKTGPNPFADDSEKPANPFG